MDRLFDSLLAFILFVSALAGVVILGVIVWALLTVANRIAVCG